MRQLLIVTSAIALAACVAQEPLLWQTSSGKAEATFSGVSLEQVRNEFVHACMSTGGEVQSDAYSVTCGKRNDGMRGMFAQAMLGNRFSQTPWEKIRFNMVSTPTGVFVTTTGWMEMTMGFGEVKRIPYEGNNFRNMAQRALDAAAARLGDPESTSESAPQAPSFQDECRACKTIGGK